jgi:hypothetical protein
MSNTERIHGKPAEIMLQGAVKAVEAIAAMLMETDGRTNAYAFGKLLKQALAERDRSAS